VWKAQEEFEKPKKHVPMYKRLPTMGEEISSAISINLMSVETSSILCRNISANQFYQYFQVLCILLTVGLEIMSIDSALGSFHFVAEIGQIIVLQGFFVFDILIRIHAQYPSWAHYFDDSWNVSDFCLMLVTMIPIITNGIVDQQLGEIFRLLRILRVLRILRLLNWIHDLNVSSTLCTRGNVLMILFQSYIYVRYYDCNWVLFSLLFLFATTAHSASCGGLGESFVFCHFFTIFVHLSFRSCRSVLVC
jgi:hypothetical protein